MSEKEYIEVELDSMTGTLIRKFEDIGGKIDLLELEKKKCREELMSYLKQADTSKVIVDDENEKLLAAYYLVKENKKWDIEYLKKLLDKKTAKKVIVKKVTTTEEVDIEALENLISEEELGVDVLNALKLSYVEQCYVKRVKR
jgi:site-specific DNA-adenine methylase